MSADLVPYQPTDSWVPVLTAVGDLAQKLAPTEFVGKGFRGKPAAVAAAILTGREMGLGPMAALRGIDVVDGRPSLSAQMTAARVYAAGHAIGWVESTDQRATVRITRGDGLGEGTATFSMSDAVRAGLADKANWRRYPRHMLRARALSEVAGMVCPDVILGLDTAMDPPDHRMGDSDAAGRAGTTVIQLTQAPLQAQEAPVEAINPPVAAPVPETPVIVSEAPSQPADDAPDLITAPQMRKMRALLGKLNSDIARTPDEQRELIRDIVGLPELASAKDLTKQQATTAIDALQQLTGG